MRQLGPDLDQPTAVHLSGGRPTAASELSGKYQDVAGRFKATTLTPKTQDNQVVEKSDDQRVGRRSGASYCTANGLQPTIAEATYKLRATSTRSCSIES